MTPAWMFDDTANPVVRPRGPETAEAALQAAEETYRQCRGAYARVEIRGEDGPDGKPVRGVYPPDGAV